MYLSTEKCSVSKASVSFTRTMGITTEVRKNAQALFAAVVEIWSPYIQADHFLLTILNYVQGVEQQHILVLMTVSVTIKICCTRQILCKMQISMLGKKMNNVIILSNECKCKETHFGMRLQIIHLSCQELWSQCIVVRLLFPCELERRDFRKEMFNLPLVTYHAIGRIVIRIRFDLVLIRIQGYPSPVLFCF